MDSLPLSLLNDYLFCDRRAALKIVDGLRRANVHTLVGDLAHEHADLPGYEVARGVTLLRALPVWSERLALSGKCDIVERHPDGTLLPVEYKKGKRRRFDNDDAQLCAQALCLEEMFARPVPRGAVFHAASRRRREVAFTAKLRAETERAAAETHALQTSDSLPPAVLKPSCEECSLYDVCLPQVTSQPPEFARVLRQLYAAL